MYVCVCVYLGSCLSFCEGVKKLVTKRDLEMLPSTLVRSVCVCAIIIIDVVILVGPILISYIKFCQKFNNEITVIYILYKNIEMENYSTSQ